MKLILVESPTKARTLSRFLQGAYTVEATMGHIRDLPKSELGVAVESDFLPTYVIPTDKKKRVSELKALAKQADEIILATDPDREGEAIAWHLATILCEARNKISGKKVSTKTKSVVPASVSSFKRIVFHEITEQAIHDALDHARSIDEKLVDAQQARRVLDRLVGYKLSPLLWQKLSKRWLSAGRVQSVAVRLIVEREKEIAAFQNEPYFTILATFTHGESHDESIDASLIGWNDTFYEETKTHKLFDGSYSVTKTTIQTEQEAQRIISDWQPKFRVSHVETNQIKRSPPAPFTTSTLQQEAGRKLYFSSKKTMQIAQKLYEEGYISYHRTDSVNLSEKFLGEARLYIKNTFGEEYVPIESRQFKTKSKVAQEAHEAIRPTNVDCVSLADQVHELNRDHERLYELIWKRAVGSQAKEALFESTKIKITSSNAYLFSAQGSVVVFDGFLRIIGRDVEDKIIPKLTVGDEVTLVRSVVEPHTTSSPPRYTEATLVKTLEEKDIGRPSTYAPIISTIQDRQYVEKKEKKLCPTELGVSVTEFLVKHFPEVMELPFTATIESELDSVANGEKQWVPVIRSFYEPFSRALETTYQTATKVKVVAEEIGEACPSCQHALVLRTGKFGKFVACSTFPECKYTRQYAEKIDIPCPKCGGAIVAKKSKKGKMFYGCSNYPTCTFASWKKEDIK